MGFPCTFLFTERSPIHYHAVGRNAVSRNIHAGPASFHQGESDFTRRTMAAAKMTQSQIVKTLAEKVGVSNKVAKTFTTEHAALAIAETKKNGMFVVPGLGRLVRVD